MIVAVANNSGSTITTLNVAWDFEKYRAGTRPFDWTFFHGNSATAATAETTGNQSYVADGANAVVSPPTAISKNVSLTGLSVPAGSTYYLRWTFTGVGGSTNGQGIGIDNLSITATGAAGGANVGPTNTVPGAQTTAEDTALVFSTANSNAISIADPDAGTANVQVALTVTNGTLSLSGTAGLTGTGNGTNSLTYTGPISAINTALQGLSFAPTANFFGSAQLSLSTNDLGNTGTGGPLTDVDTVNISVTASNDAPTIGNNLGLTVAEGAAATPITTTLLQVNDVDNTPVQIVYTVTVLPTAGTLALSGTPLLLNGTFTQADLNNGLVTYAQGGGENVSDLFTFTVSDGAGGAISATNFAITITPVNDNPAIMTNAGLTIAEGAAATPITTALLLVSDVDSTPLQITYTVTVLPTGGTLALSGTPLLLNGTFTQADVNNGLVTYAHGGGESPNDSFTFTVSDGAGGAIAPTVFAISVTPVNDAPTITTNAGLTVAEGAPATAISNARLQVSDVDSTPAQLVYTLTTAPTNGTLALGGTPLLLNGTFTQADINNGLLSYAHNGSDTISDSFAFTVSDGGSTIPSTTFNITITAVNDAPVLATNAPFTVAEGAAATPLTAANLLVTDADNTPVQLVFTVTTLPANGVLALSGTPLTANQTFTQADINNGLLTYAHNGSETLSDSFAFIVSDGGSTLPSSTFNITITPVNDAPTLTNNLGLTVAEGAANAVISSTRLLVSDVDSPATNIVFTVTALPANGTLARSGTPLAVNGTFTQADINAGLLTYSHSGSETLSDLFTFTVSDGAGGTVSATNFVFTVTAVNDAPILAVNTGLTVAEGAAATTIGSGQLSVGDADNTPTQLVYTVTVLPTNGTLTLSGVPLAVNGTFTQANINAGLLKYAHNGSETTSDSFTFTVSDGAGGSIAATGFAIAVTAVNDAPVLANNAGLTVSEGATGQVIGSLLLRVTDVDTADAQLAYTVTLLPANGTLLLSGTPLTVSGTFTQAQVNANLLSYSHNGSETPSDGFSFTVSDGSGGAIPASTFAITVTPVNDAPVLATNSGLANVVLNSTVVLTSSNLLTTDVDNTAPQLVYTITTAPAGTLTLTGVGALTVGGAFTQADVNTGKVSYTAPAAGVADNFAFTVSDGSASLPQATFNIGLITVNSSPIVVNNGGLTLAEGASAPITSALLQVTDTEQAAAQLTYTVTTLPVNGALLRNGTPLGANGTFTQADINGGMVSYSHNGSETTSDSFGFTVSDGAGGSIGTTTFAITVTPVNDVPVLAVNAGLTLAEGGNAAISSGQLSVTDVDTPAAAIIFTVIALPANGGLSVSGTPLAVNGTFTQADVNGGLVKYTHNGSETTTDAFNFSVSDGAGGTISATPFAITITAVNDTPILVTNTGIIVAEGAAATVIPTAQLQVTDADNSASQLIYTVTGLPTNGTLAINGTPLMLGGTFTQGNIDSNLLTYAHNGSETTSDSFTFTVSDSAGGTIAASTFAITVTPVNDAPVLAVNTGLAIAEGGNAAISGVQLSVTDVDNSPAQIVFTVTALPVNGVLSVSGTPLAINGTFTQADVNGGLVTYAHNGSETTTDAFTFSVSDGAGGTIATTPFAITITAVNDAPVIATNTGLTVAEGAAATVITSTQLQVTDVDNSAAQLTYTVTALPTHGTLALGGTPLTLGGTFTQANIDSGFVSYAHNGSETLGDAFTFTVSDGAGGTIGASTFAITVTPVNDAPVLAVNAGLNVSEGAAATTISSVRLQVTDVDTPAAQIVFTITALPANGALSRNGTPLVLNSTFTQADINGGLLTYSHNGSETTSDSFAFTVSDGTGGSIGATSFAITVTPVNDPPTIVPQTFTIAENSPNGTSVGTVAVVDPDLGDTKLFAITAGNASGAFAINQSTGAITVANSQLLNFEATPTFALTVQVTDSGNQSASNTITINLTDVVEPVDITVTPTSGLTTTEAGGTTTFSIVLTSQPTANVTISLATSDNTEGMVSTSSVTFTPLNWNVAQVITITGVDDALVDGDIAYTIDTGAAVSTDPAYSNFVVPDVSVTNLDNDTATPPTISDIANQSSLEDTALLNVPFTIGDAETPAASLTVTASSSDTTLFPPGSISLGGTGANRTISLSPAANLSGTATITVTVDDGSGGLTSDTFVVTVTAVNDAPTLNPIASIPSLPNGSGAQAISLTGITAGGGESQTLTVTAVSSNPAVIPNPSVTYTSPGSTGSLSFTPIAGQAGTVTITVTVTDNGGTANGGVNTITRTFTVTVAPGAATPGLVAIIPDVENPGKNVLVINGTTSLDVITVTRSGTQTFVFGPLSGARKFFPTSGYDRILINGLAGSDRIILDPSLTKPATINGDDGSDMIFGAAGNDILRGGDGSDFIYGRGGDDFIYGDAGKDYLFGEAGKDVIIGGLDDDWISGGTDADILNGGGGTDTIFGDSGDDLIISGNFSLAGNMTELLALQATWTSTQPFNTRIANLATKVNSTTVTSDGKIDWVYTGTGRDWAVDYALLDLLFDFNYSATNGDKRN